MKLIECKELCMKYEGVPAFENLSFTIDEGDFLCIIGENGSGKSTLVKGILGLKKFSSGSIEFTGVKPNEIGYLPQQTAAQKDFPATVKEVVRAASTETRCSRSIPRKIKSAQNARYRK